MDGTHTYYRESRRLNYKNKGQFRQDELKKKREEQQVEIRKQKREESIAKRRNLQAPSGAGGDSDEDEAVATQLDSQVGHSNTCLIRLNSSPLYVLHLTMLYLFTLKSSQSGWLESQRLTALSAPHIQMMTIYDAQLEMVARYCAYSSKNSYPRWSLASIQTKLTLSSTARPSSENCFQRNATHLLRKSSSVVS